MAVYIVRRLIAAFFILIGASFIVYMLMTQAGNPLAFTIAITNPTQRAAVVSSVTETLSLDVHPVQRYLDWLQRLLFEGDFGLVSQTQQPVWDELKTRVPLTLKLVTAATVMSVVVGVSVGMLTALRQYSGFDYLVTFFTFVFFSLPVFWVAVILKAWGGINFNDWLRDGAHFSVTFIVAMSIVAAVIGSSMAGGRWPRKALFGVVSGAAAAGLLSWISSHQWMLNPRLGPVVFALISIAVAVAVIAVMAGWGNAHARNAALVTAAIGIISYFPMQTVFDGDMSLWKLFGLGIVAILVGVAAGYAMGGFDKGQSARTAAVTAFLVGVVMSVDRAMQSWGEYSASSVIRNRPIKTIGDREDRLEGSFWVIVNDTFSHLVLPTLALMLISVAVYTRYTRASMLEVLNQDYIRTARAKGLTNRTVVVRHAFRNALIPLATIVAFDISGIIGGAVITESVFEWEGMGRLFIDGLREIDPNRVMAFFVITGLFAVVFNLLADITYAVLDPRIRVGE
ncbi:MAG: ABC transporter permease [Actinomycetota bacterium]|nr:ABC transporter permease [Actinomycetota bacterium]